MHQKTPRQYVHDLKESGLLLQIDCAGHKSFRLYEKHQDRPVRITIGPLDDWTVENARKRVREIKAQLDPGGPNPNDTTRAQRQETTSADLFNEYLERHAKAKKRIWEEDQRQSDKYLGSLTMKMLSAISRRDILAIHSKIGKDHLTTVNRILALISSFETFAVADDARIKPIRTSTADIALDPARISGPAVTGESMRYLSWPCLPIAVGSGNQLFFSAMLVGPAAHSYPIEDSAIDIPQRPLLGAARFNIKKGGRAHQHPFALANDNHPQRTLDH